MHPKLLTILSAVALLLVTGPMTTFADGEPLDPAAGPIVLPTAGAGQYARMSVSSGQWGADHRAGSFPGSSGPPASPGSIPWNHSGFQFGRSRPAMPQQSHWFQRPYPYHLDYYRMKYGGGYDPYFGNLYGPPIYLVPPYGFQAFPGAGFGPAFRGW
jgi:hypothetical protein